MRLIDLDKVYESACAGCTRHGDAPGECYHDEPCERLIVAFTTAEPVDAAEVARRNWIPVSERPPEEVLEDGEKPHTASALVLVAVMDDENRRFVSDDITFDGEWVNFRFPEFEVTHWMPLPEPPKEGHHET